MTARALTAIASARLRAERRVVFYACTGAIVAGLLQPRGSIWPTLLGSLLGIAIALAQSPGRRPYLDRCEQGAPLFGRELARAKALVPCIAAVVASAAYLCAQFAAGSRDGSTTLLVAPPAVLAATLIALCATIRSGWARAFYVALAMAASAVAYALAALAHSIPGELAFCALVAFFALRQYGEALARYDPVEGI